MEVLYFLVPLAAVLVLLVVGALVWAVRSGQFEDLEGPAHRILIDDEQVYVPSPASGERSTSGEESATFDRVDRPGMKATEVGRRQDPVRRPPVE